MSDALLRKIRKNLSKDFEGFILIGLRRGTKAKQVYYLNQNEEDAHALNNILSGAMIPTKEPVIPEAPVKTPIV